MKYHAGKMTAKDFREIRAGLLMTQRELAEKLGYSHKMRISEYERQTSPVAIPYHIQLAMVHLWEGRSTGKRKVVRDWTRWYEKERFPRF